MDLKPLGDSKTMLLLDQIRYVAPASSVTWQGWIRSEKQRALGPGTATKS